MTLIRSTGLVLALTAGCAGNPDATDTSTAISPGMGYEEVFVMLGDYDTEREFRGDVTALQFCSGASKEAEYVMVWFIGNQLEGVTRDDQEIPDDERCGWFFKEIDWTQAPDIIKSELFIE